MHAAVVVFPGSNCDRDLAVAFEAAGAKVTMVWHKDTTLPDGVEAYSFTRGRDWFGVVTSDDQILIYGRSSGTLQQTVQMSTGRFW